ncbi:MAG: dihydrofolate reductase family protein [Taibaiella sp.]|jgi:dihydrofolate reductase
MRKIILDLAVTLDGFIEGPNGEIDWCIMDGESNFGDFLAGIDTILYGRISYDLWGNYQPGADEDPFMKDIYKAIHSKTKYVFSTTKQDDGKATFIHSNIKEAVGEIVKQPGKDIWLYGGGKLITTFINLGLVDVFQLAVHPVILGSGKPLFQDIKDRMNLKLTGTKTSESGVVFLSYSAEKKNES